MNKSDSETRRVKMTKRMMKDALMELMADRPLASISVTELCRLADVNRSTFYTYYCDLVELLRDIEDDLIGQLPKANTKETTPDMVQQMVEDFTTFFGYVRKHSGDFNVLLQNGNFDFSERLLMTAMQHFPKPDLEKEQSLMKRWGFIYTMNGVIGLLRDWIKNGFPVDDRSFAKTILQISVKAYEAINP